MTLQQYTVDSLITLFNNLFQNTENTRLVRGDSEPLYLPAQAGEPYAQIIFAHGYFASALHEVAHWCIAGKARRMLEDYGYWYCPDGRDHKQQMAFEEVEVKPQAIEWAFAVACHRKFNISVDNLNGEEGDSSGFAKKVHLQALRYLQDGFPPRANMLLKAMGQHFHSPVLTPEYFALQHINREVEHV